MKTWRALYCIFVVFASQIEEMMRLSFLEDTYASQFILKFCEILPCTRYPLRYFSNTVNRRIFDDNNEEYHETYVRRASEMNSWKRYNSVLKNKIFPVSSKKNNLFPWPYFCNKYNVSNFFFGQNRVVTQVSRELFLTPSVYKRNYDHFAFKLTVIIKIKYV